MKLTKRAIGITAAMMLLASTAHGASYTVQSGDSLWKVATKNNLSVQQLKTMNGLSSDVIYPGQQLRIPGPTPYTVQNNETMWTISRKFGISLEELIRANPQIPNPNNIWTGLTVYIPESAPLNPVIPTAPAPAKPAQFAEGVFPLAKGTYQQPVVNNYSESRYWTPSGAEVRKHEGVDIFAEKGTPVYSAMDGEIINFGWNEYGGWRVTVRVDSTTAFYYAHLSKYAPGIGKGSKVTKGQLIGYVGSTGYGPEGTEGQFVSHLHFGIYKTSGTWTTIDPFNYLKWWESQQK